MDKSNEVDLIILTFFFVLKHLQGLTDFHRYIILILVVLYSLIDLIIITHHKLDAEWCSC